MTSLGNGADVFLSMDCGMMQGVPMSISCGRRDLQTLYFLGGWRDARRDRAGRKEDY